MTSTHFERSGTCSPGCGAALPVRRVLVQTGNADVLKPSMVARSKGSEVPPGLGEAETTVRTAAALVGVVVVLAVIFPKAHGADLEVATPLKRQIPATRTRIRLASRRPMHVDEHTSDCRVPSGPATRAMPFTPEQVASETGDIRGVGGVSLHLGDLGNANGP